MKHDPEEIKAVADKIGKLYGYNVEAIARNVLDVLRPFREKEVAAARQATLAPVPNVYGRGVVADYGHIELRVLSMMAATQPRVQLMGPPLVPQLVREMMDDINAAREAVTGVPTARHVGKHPALGTGYTPVASSDDKVEDQ